MNRRAVLASVSGALLVTALIPAATSAAPAPTPPGPDTGQVPAGVPRGDVDGDHVSDEFAPRLRAAAAGEKLAVIIRGVGADRAGATVGPFRVTQQLPLVDGFSAVMTAAQARALARHPGVFRVDQDGQVRALDDATDSDYGATAAWADRPGLDGSGVGICVIDTGADPGHEQIAPRTVTFHDFVGTRATAYDDHGHGTHVMSIAAGDGVGGSSAATYRGVAPAAELYAAKVLDSTGYGSDSQVIAGIQWCHDQAGVRVLSMSLGDTIVSDGSDPVSDAVNAAESGGDVVVVAAGNSGDAPGTIAAPGVATGALTVGAASDWSAPVGTARHDDGIWLAAFSSRGPVAGNGRTKPDVTAPGVSVTAANAGTASGYVTMSGTSMATPYVAGAVALGLEAASSATPAQVRSAVMTSAADRGPAGLDNEWGAGLLDVRAFVDTLAGAASPRRTAFPTWTRTTGSVPTNGSVNVPITVGTDGLGVPLAVTLTVTSGQLSCDLYCQLGSVRRRVDPGPRRGAARPERRDRRRQPVRAVRGVVHDGPPGDDRDPADRGRHLHAAGLRLDRGERRRWHLRRGRLAGPAGRDHQRAAPAVGQPAARRQRRCGPHRQGRQADEDGHLHPDRLRVRPGGRLPHLPVDPAGRHPGQHLRGHDGHAVGGHLHLHAHRDRPGRTQRQRQRDRDGAPVVPAGQPLTWKNRPELSGTDSTSAPLHRWTRAPARPRTSPRHDKG